MPENDQSPQEKKKVCPILSEGNDLFEFCMQSDCAWWHEPEYEEEQGCCALLRIAQASWKSMED